MGEVSRSPEYKSFRSTVSQKKIVVDDSDKPWILYDAGPRCVRCPLVCLPPASGRADVFFKQLLALASKGYRVLAIDYPVYWHVKEWCEGFRKLLDYLQLDKVHVLGASLGGFFAQKFAEHTHLSPRVQSLILCNTFADTNVFQQSDSASTFWMMPALLLKKMVMGSFDKGPVDKDIAESIDFMVQSLDSLNQQELASRLTLNCMPAYVEPQMLQGLPITIMDVYDPCALSHGVKEEMYKCYPDARRAHLKDGGNFPYLSRAGEVNVYIQIHLKEFWNTKFNAMEPNPEIVEQLKAAEPQGPSCAGDVSVM